MEVARFACMRSSLLSMFYFRLQSMQPSLVGEILTESSGIHYIIIGISQISFLGAIGAVASFYKTRPLSGQWPRFEPCYIHDMRFQCNTRFR